MFKKIFKIGCLSMIGFFGLMLILAGIGTLIGPPVVDEAETDQEISEKPQEELVEAIEEPKKKSKFDKLYEKSVYQIHAIDLTREYDANEFAADEKYKGQIIVVEGSITHFDETFGNASIQLETGDMFMSLICSMQRSEKPILATLTKGQDVLVVGRLEGLSAGLFLSMEKCLVMPISEH